MNIENFAVVDIETTGLDPALNSILSIGAVDFLTGDEFYIEVFAKEFDPISEFALAVNGWSLEDCYRRSNISQKDAYGAFLEWCKQRNIKLLAGQQVGSFDILFLHDASGGGKTEFEKYFSKRSIDLHSVAFGKFGKSLSLDGVLKELGLKPEPKPHNALTGAKLERDALKILLN
jgi:DNA polymerase III epsilon subunit-like protein